MIEDMEIKMRNMLQEVSSYMYHDHRTRSMQSIDRTTTYMFLWQVYFGKTRDIVHDLRSVDDLERAQQQRDLQKELAGLIKR